MKIAILVSMINNFGQKGFYNSQEIGIAKALIALGDSVVVYKLLHSSQELPANYYDDGFDIRYYHTKNIGINGLVDTAILDSSIDALFFFADTQLSVPNVYKWCKRNNVKFIPYIGVTESHSNNKLVRLAINALFTRNVRVFKKCTCLAKTPTVKEKLHNLGVKNVLLAPVGLDLTLLNTNYESTDKNFLKKKYGYSEKDKVLLFIGRLVPEKQPERLINLFAELSKIDNSYKLLMVGKGELKEKVLDAVLANNLNDKVNLIESIPNSEVWEFYRFAEAFINLNEQEIFGMVILEAMYYGCKVIALHAPGPDYIIENGISGVLCSDNAEIISAILDNKDFSKSSHNRILEHFTWSNSAYIIKKCYR